MREVEIISAVEEERFSRKKNDSSFTKIAISYCLKSNNLNLKDIINIFYYEKSLLTFERFLEAFLVVAPRGVRSFIAAIQVWLREKLFLKAKLKKSFKIIQKDIPNMNEMQIPDLLFAEHHKPNAFAAFYPIPFEEAVILCMESFREWAKSSAWISKGNKIKLFREINFPYSIGLPYSAFTLYCGYIYL